MLASWFRWSFPINVFVFWWAFNGTLWRGLKCDISLVYPLIHGGDSGLLREEFSEEGSDVGRSEGRKEGRNGLMWGSREGGRETQSHTAGLVAGG